MWLGVNITLDVSSFWWHLSRYFENCFSSAVQEILSTAQEMLRMQVHIAVE